MDMKRGLMFVNVRASYRNKTSMQLTNRTKKIFLKAYVTPLTKISVRMRE